MLRTSQKGSFQRILTCLRNVKTHGPSMDSRELGSTSTFLRPDPLDVLSLLIHHLSQPPNETPNARVGVGSLDPVDESRAPVFPAGRGARELQLHP